MPTERRLAAIMFTDIVGYTALMARDEEAGRRARDRHEAVVRPLVEKYLGEWIERTGDETLSSFPSALDAVNCSLAVQAELEGDADLRLRIGIHQGDVTFDEGGVSGDGVNVAARVRPMAKPGGVCISGDVHHSVRGRPGLTFESLGEQDFKNVDHPVPVFVVTGTAEPPRAVAKPESTPASARSSRGAFATAGLLVVAIGAGWWLYQSSADLAPIRSIAVLPLENLSGDPDQEYFADGMTEALIGGLAKIEALSVISRTSSMAYRESDKTLPQIARELNVDAIVEGTVMRAGDRVRITAQLIRASSDEHLWSDSYDRDLRDILAVHSEVAQAIAGEIELKLSRPEQPGEAARPVDPGAFEAYLKGRHHWNKRTGADIRKSIEYFETAIALDPDWALAHSGLAEAYVILPIYSPTEDSHRAMRAARAAAARALELDDDLAPAHSALAGIGAWYDWDWQAAEVEFERALELDPSYAMARSWYSAYLSSQKRDRALEEAHRASELDPLSTIIATNVSLVALHAGEYDRAIEEAQKGVDLNPLSTVVQVMLARAYTEKGMHEEAVAVAERMVKIDGTDPRALGTLAGTYARAGRRTDALRILGALPVDRFEPRDLAAVHAALGDADAAFAWLEKAYDDRTIWVVFLDVDPAFDPLRSDPRFQDLLRRIGLPESPDAL